MSEVQTPEKPIAPVAPEKPVKFNTDAFENCTARCTRQAWDLYLAHRANQALFENTEFRCRITAASDTAASEIAGLLKSESSLYDLTLAGKQIHLNATLAQIMLVIKHDDLRQFDAAKIQSK